MNVPFNIPPLVGTEVEYLLKVLQRNKLAGDYEFSKACDNWFEENFQCQRALLTTSCTHALEMSAVLAHITQGDEVIMPSFTFVSTANAFVLRGAKIVFVDIRPDTLNINEQLIEEAITDKTKAIVPVHYAGVACEMDMIMDIARRHSLLVIEDAAQGVMSKYKGRFLGTIGHLGCYSFHETKNYTSGEGGAIIINDERFLARAEVIREKGTNRSKFLRGQVDKYTWVDLGSSYLPSEFNAACLLAQLEEAEKINQNRLKTWELYFELLKPLQDAGVFELPLIPKECQHNAGIFYLKVKNKDERYNLMNYLQKHGVKSTFHYIPLHSSEAGQRFGVFSGVDQYTTEISQRIIRLPLYYGLEPEKVEYVVSLIKSFFKL